MLYFVTGNEGKVREAREYLTEPIEQCDIDYPERQATTTEAVAVAGARTAFEATDIDALIVDDSGLFIEALEGFPGPYSAYVEETLGIDRVQQLVADEPTQRALFRSVIAYATTESVRMGADHDGTVHDDATPTVVTFTGTVTGEIVPARGDGGFGYDPIFEHDGRTFAEMDPDEKNAISHRGRALEKFARWRQDQ